MSNIIHHLIVAFLVIAIPIWDRWEVRRIKRSTDPRKRIHTYQLTIAWLWSATVLLLLSTPLAELVTPLPAPGFALHLSKVLPVLGGLAIGALVPILISRFRPKAPGAQVKSLGDTLLFMPRTPAERWWFAAVSISAGICEEVIFRGFLIRYLATLPVGMGLTIAVLVAAVIFGIAHGYQGIVGVLLTGLVALLMTALFFATGSLVVPMVVHALLDLRVLLLRITPKGPTALSAPDRPSEQT